ncbi:MAG: hypothetical protein AAFY02_00470 [Pseudomonadota bacterium]
MFQARLPDGAVETALVRSLSQDAAGIVHVRFDLLKEKPHMLPNPIGPRILSLRAFRDRFRHQVGLPDAQAAE